jgi:hypothetical protein
MQTGRTESFPLSRAIFYITQSIIDRQMRGEFKNIVIRASSTLTIFVPSSMEMGQLTQQLLEEHKSVSTYFCSLKYQNFISKIKCFWGAVPYSLVEV